MSKNTNHIAKTQLANLPFIKYVRGVYFIIISTAVICLAIIFKSGFDKVNFSKAMFGSTRLVEVADSTQIDKLLLNKNDINFNDKKSFVLSALYFVDDTTATNTKINNSTNYLTNAANRQKLYNLIIQKKLQQNAVKQPAQTNNDDGFSIKPIPQ